jgi:hypothetical protein
MTLNGKGIGGVQPTIAQQLAFADNACSALYDNIYVKAGGSDISIITNYVAQSGALKTRLQKTGAWLSTVGKSAYLLESDFNKRVNAVARDTSTYPDGQPQRLFVGNAANQTTGTVAIDVAGVITGVNTALLQLARGDTLVVEGVSYTVNTSPTNNTGTNSLVSPIPAVAVPATTNAYIIKNTGRKDGGQRNKVYVVWQPPVGIFDHAGVLGSGEYRISMNPNTNYKFAAVQTLQGDDQKSAPQTVTADGGWDLVINSVKLYVATVKADIPAGISTLYLTESQVQNKPMTGLDQTFDFVVPPSTRALTIFVQSNTANSNPRFPPTMFKLPANQDLLLESLQVSYANLTKPSTRWTSSFTDVLAGVPGSPSINELQQRYNDSLMECGLISSVGGCETFQDYLSRGPYYHFNFSRDSDDKSTQVQVACKINFTNVATVGCNLFLVAWYTRGVEMTQDGGMIQQVRSLAI